MGVATPFAVVELIGAQIPSLVSVGLAKDSAVPPLMELRDENALQARLGSTVTSSALEAPVRRTNFCVTARVVERLGFPSGSRTPSAARLNGARTATL